MTFFSVFFNPIFEYVAVAVYVLVIVYTVVRILLDTSSTPKTLAYILLVLILPLLGMIFYFSFGVNYRHKESTRERKESEEKLFC